MKNDNLLKVGDRIEMCGSNFVDSTVNSPFWWGTATGQCNRESWGPVSKRLADMVSNFVVLLPVY